METDNKVSNDLYKVYGEAFYTKNVATQTESMNSSGMITKLNHVRGLADLQDSEINNLLRATDNL